MRLLVDLSASWTRTPDGATVGAGVSLRVGPFRQLPLNLDAWRAHAVYAGVERAATRVVAAVERTTEGGWPLTLVATEVAGTRRLHALYRFLVYGVVAVVEGEAQAFDAAMDEAQQVLVAARPDFGTGQPRAVYEVWAGFDEGSRAAAG